MDSILLTVKKALGITEEQTVFDPDIIMHINSVLMILNQIGIGPEGGYRIEDDLDEWTDFIGRRVENLEAVKTYVCLRVRLLFDPPTGSVIMDSIKQSISELEWRLNVEAESTE